MRVLITLITTFSSCYLWAELPSGNTTITGDISITSDTQTMTIDQQSNQAIIAVSYTHLRAHETG